MNESKKRRAANTLFFIYLALAGEGAQCHGGDNHDTSSVPLLRSKIIDDLKEDKERIPSRFSLGIIASSSQGLVDSRSKRSVESSNLDESRLSLAFNYRLSQALSLNLMTAFSSNGSLQDPSLGSTYVLPMPFSGVQSISFAGIAAPVSINSREQGRILALNLSSGVLASSKVWTVGIFGSFGIPIYDSKGRDSELDEGSHEEEHAHAPETFLAGGSLRIGYRLGREFRLDALFDSTAKRLISNVTVFDSEITLAKICFLGAGWEAGIGFGWKEENAPSFRFPISPLSKLNLTVWR